VLEARRLGVPVILSTGSDPGSLPEAFRSLPFVKKPWTMTDLENAFRQVFG
jgi:hypothetical protein